MRRARQPVPGARAGAMFLTIKIKIILAVAAIIGLVVWFLVFLLNAQFAIVDITDRVLKNNVQAIQTAADLKHAFILYDDTIFRYLATDDPTSLEESRRTQEIISRRIDQMRGVVKSDIERLLLSELTREIRVYYRQVQDLLRGFASVDRKKNILALVMRADEEAAGKKLPTIAQEHAVALLTAEGRARLTRIYTSCEKLVDINRVRLEEAQRNIDTIMRRSTTSVFRLGGAVLGVILMISLVLAVGIIHPLAGLLRGVHKVAAGDLDLEIPVKTGDEVGKLTQAFNTMTRKLKEEHGKLLTQTITDQLTGVHNFRYFQEFLSNEFSRATRYTTPFSLLIIDIDHFKHYNDTSGHQMGNVILKDVAIIMKEALRREDFLARYGGEEFVIVLPETPAAAGRKVAERIRLSIEQSEFPAGEKQPGGRLTISLGGASFPPNGDFTISLIPKQFIEQADQALYEAKRSGRNRVVWFGAAAGDA